MSVAVAADTERPDHRPVTAPHEGSGFTYRPALDGVRAFAVLSVIAYHLGYGVAAGGFLGVDTFFVLSGYLITSLLVVERASTGRIALSGFWSRRARRLLPAMMLVVTSVALWAAFVAPKERLATIRGDALATLLYVANWRFISSGQSYFDQFNDPSPLRHMWSLAIEEQFYVAWPLLVLGCLALARGRHRVLLALAAVGAVVSVAGMALTYGDSDPSRSYYGTDTRVHALLVGAVTALLARRWLTPGEAAAGGMSPARRRVAVLLAGTGVLAGLAVLWAFHAMSDQTPFYYRGGSALFAVAVALVIVGAEQGVRSPLRSLLSLRPLVFVGAISYGLYLWHWPVQLWLTPSNAHVSGNALSAVRLVVTFAVSLLSYYLVEQPVRRGRPLGIRLTPRRLAFVVPVAMVLVGATVLAGTRGATPGPAFASTDIEIPAVPTASPVTGSPTKAGPAITAAVVGDSVAVSLSEALTTVGQERGWTVVPAAFGGCGMASGFQLDAKGKPFTWSQRCFAEVPKAHDKLVATYDPELVYWYSSRELFDRRGDDGTVVRLGTAEHRAAVRASMEESYRRLTRGGAHIVLVPMVPGSENTRGVCVDRSNRPPQCEPQDGALIDTYNKIYLDFAAAHRDRITVVRIDDVVCPSGAPCPSKVDGEVIRPDGYHYTEKAAARIASLVLDRSVAALGGDRGLRALAAG